MNLVDNRMGGSHGSYHERQQLDTPTSFKILVIGERGCGKSTVIRRYLTNQFADTPPADDLLLTELTPHTVAVSPHGAVGVVFWELATTPHNLIKREQYQNCNAVIVVVKSLDEDLRATMLLWQQNVQDDLGEGGVPVLMLINHFSDIPETVGEYWHGTGQDGWCTVRPASGEGSVYMAVNQLLRKLTEKCYPKPYPVSEH